MSKNTEVQEIEIDVSMFWNIYQTLTYNKLFNFIVGNRGGGKTYGSKEFAIENFIKRGEQFGYVRRYKDDLKEPMIQYFKDIEEKYPDYEFKTDSKYFYIRKKEKGKKDKKWTEKDIAGHGFVLSTANNKKSISYPKISTLIFDEFLLDKGMQRFLEDEPTKFLNLYETIARPGSGHIRVRVFFLANAISITNPYFLFFDLRMPSKQDRNGKWVWTHKTKSVLVEDVRNEKFIDAKKNTEFGQLVDGTKYADYSIENKFMLDDDTFIERKTGNAVYCFSITYKTYKFGVWASEKDGKMWVSKDIDPSYLLNYSLTLKDHSPNTMFFKSKYGNNQFRRFIENYKLGLVYFESMDIKNLTYEIVKMALNA